MRTSLKLDLGAFHPQAENSTTLPSDWYFNSDIYQLEKKSIFFKSWWYQCHITDITSEHPSYLGNLVGRTIEIRLSDNGTLNAFSGNQPLGLENYAGFLFINFDLKALPLTKLAPQFLKDMYECCPRLDQLVRVRRFEREIAANWKTLIDNNHECYHCNANHPSLMELVDYDNKAVWSDDGITFSHKVETKHAKNTAYCVDQETLEQDSLFGYIWPALIPLFFPGTPNLIMFQVLPLAPERSLVRHDYYLIDSNASKQERDFMHWFSEVLNFEDVSLCEQVQRGLHSRGYQQGRFIVDRDRVEYSEHHVHFFQKLVKESLVG